MTKEQQYILKEFYSLAKNMPEEYVDVLIDAMTGVFKDIIEKEFPNEWKEFQMLDNGIKA